MLWRESRSAMCTRQEEDHPKCESDPAAADIQSGLWDEDQPDFGAQENGG